MSAPGLVVLVGAPALLGVLAFFAFHWWRTRKVGTLAFHRRTFMTPNEVEFYHRLRKACGEDYVVMAQVSMAAVIENGLKSSHSLYWEVRRLYSGRIIDYVLCAPKDLVPRLVVELDDKMHDFKKDATRDGFLSRAGLRTVRFWSRNKPEVAELRRLLDQAMGVRNG